ncbi:hypothetical protein A7A78_01360 [Aequorivita soesokkakensis]|uniref:TonB-dependent receptor plug domain-containing protein n=1 Tax=Aequorivita soesokkakensis TaxID=1385699 RepID=A0A1A9LHB1_9FLAO|nr:carboxypeptidase-like regulatory domain-containing protein [Aequorivita soesokkakensis]OAD92583.1 hypothetical protein A7A78_01360 [Aequorivita soesokkakensis]
MIKKSIFIAFLLFGIFATAQIPKSEVAADTKVFPKENVQLSINSNLLLAGELLQYKAYNLSAANKKSSLSKVLYVSMRNENDSVVFSHKLKVENGTANGDFFIPSSLKTGIYRLIGYTNFSRNNSQDAFVERYIYVLNSFVKTEKIIGKSMDTVFLKKTPEFTPQENLKSQLGNQITTDKTIYGYREKVTVNIENLPVNNRGNYVLSVRKMDPIEISDKSTNSTKGKLSETFYIPELRGEIISGVVFSKTSNQPMPNKEVSLTIPGKDYVFKIAKTNSNGRFFFSVPEGYNAEKSIVQLNETPSEATNFNLVLDKKDFDLGKKRASFLKLGTELKNWLQERSVQMQIENAYYDAKKDSILKNEMNLPFYNNLGTVFLLDDYTRFSTVKETFVEVVTLAAIRGSGSDSRFVVNNEYDPNGTANFNAIPPLVLMDGMQILNNEDLINYNAREIKSIRVINQPYRFGPKLFSGVIAVETKKGDFVPTKKEGYIEELNLPPAVKDKKYFRPDYSQKSENARIPDYRVQLLWKADFNPAENGGVVTFYTSDVAGTFEISLEGYSEEGSYLSSKSYFEGVEN